MRVFPERNPSVSERERIVSELIRLKASGRIHIGPLWYDGTFLKTRERLYEDPYRLPWVEALQLIAAAIPGKTVGTTILKSRSASA